MKRAVLAVLLLAGIAYAQDQRTMEVNVGGPGPSSRRRAAADIKVTPEQAKRGRAWMAAAEAHAKGLQGGMRAYALLQIAKTLGPDQKAHAVELLEDALTASKGIEDDPHASPRMQTRNRLQQEILQAIVPLDPARADELLGTLDPAGRESVLRALLGYYRSSKQEGRALEIIYRIAAEQEFPYEAGAEMMSGMRAAQLGELRQLFTTALESYRNHKHTGMTLGRGDFAAMIVEFQPKLSPDIVKEAIFEVLKQAETPADDGKAQPQQISIASAQGSVAMGSYYEYRLFQLLPTLHAVDPDEAERLLKKNREVAGMLDKYPQGAGELNGGRPGAQGGPAGGATMMVGGGPGGGPGMDRTDIERVRKIMADAEKRPQDALASVTLLSSPDMKSEALQAIAQQTWKSSPSAAKEALKQLLDVIPQLEPMRQILPVRMAANLYLQMGEPDDARKVIAKGLESAAKLYEQDTNADDPNKALKAYWPSTNAYTGLLREAGAIDPAWALEQLKDVPDDEIAVVARIAMAGALLGQPQGSVTIMSQRKDGMNMMQMSVD